MIEDLLYNHFEGTIKSFPTADYMRTKEFIICAPTKFTVLSNSSLPLHWTLEINIKHKSIILFKYRFIKICEIPMSDPKSVEKVDDFIKDTLSIKSI